jgi:hypothetical protein
MTIQDLARHAPIIYLDAREPFPPLRVGYSIITQPQESPSFQRFIEIEPPATSVIEYAIWSDWDIGHLYELEHVWVYLDAAHSIVNCEASWHGFYHAMVIDGVLSMEDGHPVVYSQPGKHAFAPAPEFFDEHMRAECEQKCAALAGHGGLLITHLYLSRLQKNAADDQLIREYLRRRAFMPSWNFTRRCVITPELLVPWPELDAYIPSRVMWWVEQLRNGLA